MGVARVASARTMRRPTRIGTDDARRASPTSHRRVSEEAKVRARSSVMRAGNRKAGSRKGAPT